MIARRTAEAKENAEREARKVLGIAIQRYAADQCAESVVAAVELSGDDMKGRIIGREGRNIRAFEKATGMDVVVDDTPGVVVISGFDGVRRELARRAMEKLVRDGRIHPARIEEVVEQTRKEMEQLIAETGKQAAFDVGIHNLHPLEIECLGRLKYRTSYGQNQLLHATEVAHLAGTMAAELELDVQLAKRCGLLHDIGKSVDQEVEGSHPQIGADIARKCGEPQEVIDAIAGHHDDVEAANIYVVLVAAADAISASRPGARRETLEKYIKRLQRLEEIAGAFSGVETAYAIRAGREVRVIVSADRIDDKMAAKTCRDIAKEIEAEMTYPGEVKVTLIRESRFVETAH
jgi:ribonuclease Y